MHTDFHFLGAKETLAGIVQAPIDVRNGEVCIQMSW